MENKIVFLILISLLLLGLFSVYAVYRVVFCHPFRVRPIARQIPDSNFYRAHKGRMLKVIEDMERTG